MTARVVGQAGIQVILFSIFVVFSEHIDCQSLVIFIPALIINPLTGGLMLC